MSSKAKKPDKEKKDDEAAKEDELAHKVHVTLRNAGADFLGIQRAPEMLPTMKALLHQYTQHTTLTEVNEDGEHPLFPRSSDTGRGDLRNRGGRQAVPRAQQPTRRRALTKPAENPGWDNVELLLRTIENDRWPEIKDDFRTKDDAVTCEDFITILRVHIGHVPGRGDCVAVSELTKLHRRLCGDRDENENGDSPYGGDTETPAFHEARPALSGDQQEDVEGDRAEPSIGWDCFANFLLESCIVAEIVGSFTIVKALSHIDLYKIAPLRDAFMSLGNALGVETFIVVMKAQFRGMFELVRLFGLEREERRLISQLVDLFEIIDVNSQNAMSWADFSAHLVDQGMSEDIPKGFNIIKFGESSVVDQMPHQSFFDKAFYLKHYDKVAYIEQGVKAVKICTPDLQPFQELRDYQENPLFACYIEKEGLLVVSDSDLTLSFYDADNGLKLVRRIKVQTAQLLLCWSSLASTLYSADHDSSIYAWDVSEIRMDVSGKHYEPGKGDPWEKFLKVDGEKQHLDNEKSSKARPKSADDRLKATDEPESGGMERDRMQPWARHVEKFSGRPAERENRDGAKTYRERDRGEKTEKGEKIEGTKNPFSERKTKVSARGDSDAARRRLANMAKDRGVTTESKTFLLPLLELEVLGLLASCGIDGKVMLWDVFTGKCKTTLKGHDMGVRCMAFATSSKVLVTGGYDYNLMVWNPYVGTSIHTMKGHASQIAGIEVLGEASNQVVSADSEGCVKTWDLGTYQCLQSLNAFGIVRLRIFLSVPAHKRIICGDRNFSALDYLNTGIADQTDEEPVIKAIYVPRLNVFISACASHLRIWDAVTGVIKCVIEHKDTEITDFCVDDRGRKVFVADHQGQMRVYNTSTGCEIKKLTRHDQEVSGIIYCVGDKNVLSVSWDRSVVVHDEAEQTPKVLRTATNVHAGDITCVTFSRHLGLVATGSTDCVIAIREYARLRSVSFLLGHKSEITTLAFVDPLPLLVSADSGGNLAIWVVPSPCGKNHKYVNEVLIRFVNMQSLENSATVTCIDTIYTDPVQPVNVTPGSPTFVTSVPAAAGHPGKGNLSIYSGDEDGVLRVWDLTKLLELADIDKCASKPDWDARKGDQIDCMHTTEIMALRAQSLEQAELPMRIDQPCVKQSLNWKAHREGVRSMKIYREPDCIVTAGNDRMVKIWALEGQLMTVLRVYGQIPWHFPARANAIADEAALDDIIVKAAEIENRDEVCSKLCLPDANAQLYGEELIKAHKAEMKACANLSITKSRLSQIG